MLKSYVSSFPPRWPCFGIFIVWVIPLGSTTQQVKEDKIPPWGLWFWECEQLVFMRAAPWRDLLLGAVVWVAVLFLVVSSILHCCLYIKIFEKWMFYRAVLLIQRKLKQFQSNYLCFIFFSFKIKYSLILPGKKMKTKEMATLLMF